MRINYQQGYKKAMYDSSIYPKALGIDVYKNYPMLQKPYKSLCKPLYQVYSSTKFPKSFIITVTEHLPVWISLLPTLQGECGRPATQSYCQDPSPGNHWALGDLAEKTIAFAERAARRHHPNLYGVGQVNGFYRTAQAGNRNHWSVLSIVHGC